MIKLMTISDDFEHIYASLFERKIGRSFLDVKKIGGLDSSPISKMPPNLLKIINTYGNFEIKLDHLLVCACAKFQENKRVLKEMSVCRAIGPVESELDL